MGRSFWIMDDLAPLRQIAASVMKSPSRVKPTHDMDIRRPHDDDGQPDVVLASRQKSVPLSKTGFPSEQSDAVQPFRPSAVAIKPFDPAGGIFLFVPAPAYRMHYIPVSGRSDWPEYPPAGVRIDYYLANPSGAITLEILDAAGKTVRSYSSDGRASAPQGRGGGRGRGFAPSVLPKKAGMNRFLWDLRYAGEPASGGDMEGGGAPAGGPMAAPGVYKARLTANGVTRTEAITVRIDPRVARDGITAADLAEQTRFAVKVRDALADARALAQRVRSALDARAGDAAKLQDVYARLVTKTGPYEDQMLIDQLSNINREIGQSDQKVPASAYDRLNELLKEWGSIKADADKAMAR